jgi:hypothetical protein
MFSNIIFFITASFGFLCIAKLFGKNIQQEHSLINKYLFIIVAVYAVRFFLHGIAISYPAIYFTKLVKMVDIFSNFCFFCCFVVVFSEFSFSAFRWFSIDFGFSLLRKFG